MELVILAAGKGKRLRPITNDIPKPLVKVNKNMSIVDFQILNAIGSKNINKINIVVGYKSDEIKNHVIRRFSDKIDFNFIYNKSYDKKGAIYSLWLGIKDINDDYVITNGDTIYNKSFFELIDDEIKEDAIYIICSKRDEYKKDDMKIYSVGNCICKISKKFHDKYNILGASAGFCFIRGSDNINLFRNKLNYFINKKPNCYWHNSLNFLIDNNLEIIPIYINNNCWHEIDTIGDLKKIKKKSNEFLSM